MQTEGTKYSSTLDAAKSIVRRAGIRDGLYAGISAAYLRQWFAPRPAPIRSPG